MKRFSVIRKSARRFTLLFLVCVSAGYSSVKAAEHQPNVLFIFADDQCFETIGAWGHTDIDTPNLDRLSNSGTVFTHAYNMGAWHGAVCVASRTMLNTGRFVWRARNLEPDLQAEIDAGRFWSQQMNSAGYETFFSGKWHVKADPQKIFDHVRHVRPGMPKDVEAGYLRPIAGEPDPWSPYDRSFGGFWEGGRHWSAVLADDGEAYLNQAAESDRPFFMYLAFNAPHDPRQSPKAFVDRYPLDRIETPENFQSEYPHMEGIGAGKGLRDERLAPWPRTEYAVKVHRQEYYAIITHMDAQIGRILDALESTGQKDNTVIIFTADHGLAVGHHGLLGKQNMFEHSLRVPLMLSGPGIPQGKTIDTRVYLQDVMPTTMELAGAGIPEYVEFKSLLPLVRGERDQQYESIYGAYREDRQRAIIQDNFKLIHYPAIDVFKLFDLEKDPMEMKDLSGVADYSGKLMELKTALKSLERDMDDPLVVASGGA